MKILLTGGKGYVGSKLALELKDRGHEVTIYDLPDNILDIENLDKAVSEVDSVYHLAALAELKYTDEHPEETYDVNITGLRNTIDSCVKHGVLLNFISTCCIYGNPLELPSREDSMINPSDTYAMSKASGEYLVKMFGLARGLKFNIMRLGTVYGLSTDPTMRNDMCIQKFLRKALRGETLQVDGTGTQVRNYIHIDDLVRGLALVTDKGIVGETFNLAGREFISVIDIARECLKLSGLPEEFEYRPERKDDFRYQMVSIEKANRMLGWQPKRVFAQSLKEEYDALNNNPK